MKIIDVINNIPDAIIGKGASEKEIVNAEQALGLKFADEYKIYLQTFGAIMFDGHELSGISKAKQLDVVSLTLLERSYNPNIEKDMYVIENLGIDDVVIWQDSKGIVYEMQNGKCKNINKTLSDYIKDLVN